MNPASPNSDDRPLLPGLPAADHGRGERILHVDDEPTVTTALQRLLARIGYRVESFNCPRTASERFRAAPHEFDLVLTDLMMPGLTGLDIASLVQALRPELPVVLLSAYGEHQDSPALRAVGIHEVIAKPASIAVVAAALRRSLDRPAPTA